MRLGKCSLSRKVFLLENIFLSAFHDKLDAVRLYNIASGQPVDDSVKESLLSLEEAGKQLMSKYIEIMSTETYSESTMMDKIQQYKMKNFHYIFYHYI